MKYLESIRTTVPPSCPHCHSKDIVSTRKMLKDTKHTVLFWIFLSLSVIFIPSTTITMFRQGFYLYSWLFLFIDLFLIYQTIWNGYRKHQFESVPHTCYTCNKCEYEWAIKFRKNGIWYYD